MKKAKVFICVLSVLLILTQLSVFAAVFLDITTDTTYQPAGTTNLAFNKAVTFSSNYNNASGSWHVSGLVNGRIGMGNPLGWTTDPNDPEASENKEAWVQVDLGGIYGISRIVLWPRQDKEPAEGYPVDFTLQISADGNHRTVRFHLF